MVGMFCGFALGTILIPFGYQIILLTSIGISLIVPAVLLLMPKDDQSHMAQRSQWSILCEASTIIFSNTSICLLATFLMLIGGVIGFMEEYIALYYSWNGFDTQSVALIMTIGLLLAAAIESIGHYFDTFHQSWLFGFVAFVSFVLFGTSFIFGWVAILGVYIFIRIIRLMDISLTARLHTMTDTGARSTLFSLVTFVSEIIAVIGAASIALLQNFYPEVTSIALIGLAVGFVATLFIFAQTTLQRQ